MKFRDEYDFLSNMYTCEIQDSLFDDLIYDNVEAAFQASKTLDYDYRKTFINCNGKKAKQQGAALKLRDDWETVKYDILFKLLVTKFSKPELAKKLKSIKEPIIEHNTWHDNEYGVCTCKLCGEGKNKLGELLMKVRDRLYYSKMYEGEENAVEMMNIITKHVLNNKIHKVEFDIFPTFDSSRRYDLGKELFFWLVNIPDNERSWDYPYIENCTYSLEFCEEDESTVFAVGQHEFRCLVESDVYPGLCEFMVEINDRMRLEDRILTMCGIDTNAVPGKIRYTDEDLKTRYIDYAKITVHALTEEAIDDLEKDLKNKFK